MNATNSGSLPRREAFEDELPPAYTPSADIQHGETTVEYGPSRPFQPPPASSNSPSVARPQQQSHQPQTSGRSQRMGSFLNQLAGQLQELAIRPPGSRTESHMTGASSSSYPGHSRYAPPAMQRPLSTGSAPPPLPPRQAPGYEQSRPAPTSASSDLARGMRGLQGLRSRGKVQHHRLRQLPPLLTSQLRLVQVQRHDRP